MDVLGEVPQHTASDFAGADPAFLDSCKQTTPEAATFISTD